jgi:hypothetical protein
MSRIRAILMAAAAIVVSAVVALSTALQTVTDQEGVSCEQMRRAGRAMEHVTSKYFGAIADGFTPPEAVSWGGVEYPLGACSSGECVVSEDGCPEPILTYTYDVSSLLGGWRMYRLNAPEQFARSWWSLAQANPSQFRFWRSYKDAGADCVASGFTAAQCRTLANEINPCWKRPADGGVCHKGRLYNLPNSGGRELCDPAGEAGWVPYPCESPQPDVEASADVSFN